MNIKLISRRIHGLECWLIIRDGIELHRYLSEAIARTKYRALTGA